MPSRFHNNGTPSAGQTNGRAGVHQNGLQPILTESTAVDQAGQPILLDCHQASRLLALSLRTLWGLTTPRGPIPGIKVGRLVRYRRVDLEAWAAGEAEAARR